MSLAHVSLTDLVLLSEEAAEHEPLIHPYLVGAIALGILLAMLLGVLAFGKGREHS